MLYAQCTQHFAQRDRTGSEDRTARTQVTNPGVGRPGPGLYFSALDIGEPPLGGPGTKGKSKIIPHSHTGRCPCSHANARLVLWLTNPVSSPLSQQAGLAIFILPPRAPYTALSAVCLSSLGVPGAGEKIPSHCSPGLSRLQPSSVEVVGHSGGWHTP